MLRFGGRGKDFKSFELLLLGVQVRVGLGLALTLGETAFRTGLESGDAFGEVFGEERVSEENDLESGEVGGRSCKLV